MNATLRNAFLISTAIHVTAISPLTAFMNLGQFKPDKKESIVVDYVVIKEPPKIQEIKRELEFKIPDTPKVVIDKRPDSKPVAQENKDMLKEQEEAIRKTREEMEKRRADLRAAQEMAKKQAQIKSTKDYVDYYRLIRERIRKRLKENYKNYSKEAEVHCVFTLSADGSLAAIMIEEEGSTSDRTLLGLTTQSIKEASPFQPFPKALSLPKMSFNLVVSFKKQ